MLPDALLPGWMHQPCRAHTVRCLQCCSCLRKFGSSTQHVWLWGDAMSDLLFLVDLLLLLLSAYHTDRTANAFIASQSPVVEAQLTLSSPEQPPKASLSFGPDVRRPSLSAAQHMDSFPAASRSLVKSTSRGKRDVAGSQPGLFLAATDQPSSALQLTVLHASECLLLCPIYCSVASATHCSHPEQMCSTCWHAWLA